MAPSAAPDEAAAVVAALEQFLRDTAPPVAPAGPQRDPWQRAALLEGVGAGAVEHSPWGESHPWG